MYTVTIIESYPGTNKTGYTRDYKIEDMDRAFDVYAEQAHEAVNFASVYPCSFVLSVSSEDRVIKTISINSTITK